MGKPVYGIIPIKHKTLTQCWSQTVGQRWINIGSTSCVCWDGHHRLLIASVYRVRHSLMTSLITVYCAHDVTTQYDDVISWYARMLTAPIRTILTMEGASAKWFQETPILTIWRNQSIVIWSCTPNTHRSPVAVFNPYPARLIYLHFQPLDAVSRYRDPQPQVVENH